MENHPVMKIEQLQSIIDWDNPGYYRILHDEQFNVPRRPKDQTIPDEYRKRDYSFYARNGHTTLLLTEPEKHRYKQAQKIATDWYRGPDTCFLCTLDRIIIITTHDLDQPNAPIALVNPSTKQNGNCHTTITLENGEYELITSFPANSMCQEYQHKYPTAQHWIALRHQNRPEHPQPTKDHMLQLMETL